jgi:RNA polymerase sigma-70 factor (ECF subfamily)
MSSEPAFPELPAPEPPGAAGSSAPSDGAPPNLTTAHAAELVRGGDAARFDALYARVGPSLLAWAKLRIPSGSRHCLDSQDLLQEVWWRAMEGFERFDPAKGSFRTWVFGIATRTLLNHLRALRVRGELGDAARERARREPLPSSIALHATSVGSAIARREETQRLLAHVEALEGEERALFALCALEGRTAKEAAELLALTPAAAAKRWQRLRDRLRRAIESGELPRELELETESGATPH